jgi:hypothetical protein
VNDARLRPHASPPYRVLFTGCAAPAWYDAADDERQQVLVQLVDACTDWKNASGARFIGSVDHDLFLVGTPRGGIPWSIYLLFEVDDVETVATMIDVLRRGTPRLDRYFTFEAIIGRAFFPIE